MKGGNVLAEVKFTKDDPEFKILNEFWLLLQKYYIPEQTDEYWESLIADVNTFLENNKHPLARSLSKFLTTYLENKMKGRLENG